MGITAPQVLMIAQFIRQFGVENKRELRGRFNQRLNALYRVGTVTDERLCQELENFLVEECLPRQLN